MVLQFSRYVLVYVKLYHYLEGVLQEKGLLSKQQIVDLEGSHIQCIQRNNASSRFDCFDMNLAVLSLLQSYVFDLLEL
jgi:hypothetical protein